jgi:hypothetical protein
MNLDADGEIDISCFTLSSLKWLAENDRPFFDIVSKAVLKNNMENEKRTGQAFTSFDLQREIVEETEKRMKAKNNG